MTAFDTMWRIWPFAPFASHVGRPALAPDAPGDTLCLQINRAYLPYLLGAVSPLTFPDMYQGDAAQQQQAANYFQQVFLMLIQAGECDLPFDVRQNETTPCILEKTEDGVIWSPWADLSLCAPNLVNLGGGEIGTQPGPGGDITPVPHSDTPPLPTPPPGVDSKCLAAQRSLNVMVATYDQTVAYFVSGVQPLVAVTGIISLLAILIFFPPDFPLALTTFITLWELLTTITADQFDSDKQDTFRCDLFCAATISAGGELHYNFATVKDAVDERWGGLIGLNAWTLVSYLLDVIQSSGLDWSAHSENADTADCSDCPACPWCVVLDLTIDDYDFTAATDTWHLPQAIYSPGVGWIAQINNTRSGFGDYYTSVRMGRLLPTAHYTSMLVEGHVTYGNNDASNNRLIAQFEGTTLYNAPDPDNYAQQWDGNFTGAPHLKIISNIGYDFNSPCGGDGFVGRITLRGTGDPPAGLPLCDE